MRKTYLDLLATSRIRPKMVRYFVNVPTPITTRALSRLLCEDVGAVGHLIREFLTHGFIVKDTNGYILAATDIKEELIALSKEQS